MNRVWAWSLFILVIAGLCAALAWLIVPSLMAERRSDRVDDDVSTVEAEAAIRAAIPDAQTITFDRVFANQIGEDTVICGRADVVEPNDAVDGPERFIFSDGTLWIEQVDGRATVQDKWSDLCQSI